MTQTTAKQKSKPRKSSWRLPAGVIALLVVGYIVVIVVIISMNESSKPTLCTRLRTFEFTGSVVTVTLGALPVTDKSDGVALTTSEKNQLRARVTEMIDAPYGPDFAELVTKDGQPPRLVIDLGPSSLNSSVVRKAAWATGSMSCTLDDPGSVLTPS
jgi:hypothetical protein